MNKSDFYFDLPEELIAQTPLSDRSASRMLVLDKDTGMVLHRRFKELPDMLRPGDRLVFNDTKVIPARLLGLRIMTDLSTGKQLSDPVELLLLKRINLTDWECIAGPGKRAKEGYHLIFGDGMLSADVLEVRADGNRIVRFTYEGVFEDVLDRLGEMPLPPYIHEKLEDKNRYQTVYAQNEGSAAAPTAGLHFTPQILEELKARGFGLSFVTLHVGLGTFRPVKEEKIEDHPMHTEWYQISQQTADEINATKAAGGRIVCVGTTSCRTVESAADENGLVHAGSADTSIFIYPGYKFKTMDALITNFHLPESTLIMLVSALAGRENVLNAYREAVKEKYRFFSFGDSCFITDHAEELLNSEKQI